MIKLKHSQNPAPRARRGCFLALITLAALLATSAAAQTFTTLHSFTASNVNSSGVNTNSDGARPLAGLLLAGNTLYGTANSGGTSGNGTVFAVNSNGTGFTNLHTFTALSGSPFPTTNSDGIWPQAGLVLSGNGGTLFGTAYAGGPAAAGTVFAVNTNGTALTNLYGVTGGSNGVGLTGLILAGNTLYGTTAQGGTNNNGTVFAVNTDGTGFVILHAFTASSGPFPATNSDGASPQAGLIVSGNTLYGTATFGGTAGSGAVFALKTDGSGFTNLYNFTRGGSDDQGYLTNSDGAAPDAGLLLWGNTLYGTAGSGGSAHNGTLFAVNIDGSGFTNLHTFTASSANSSGSNTNTDGAIPSGGLILSGNTLYGTAGGGGSSGNGTVFAVTTDGTGFTTLHSFVASSANSSGVETNSDGIRPGGGLFLSGNTLYGTTRGGGTSGNGTVFSLTLPQPLLTMTVSGTDVTLSWSTNYPGWVLQQSVNLGAGGFVQINLPEPPIIVNGQFVLTLPITSSQQLFYRLSSQ